MDPLSPAVGVHTTKWSRVNLHVYLFIYLRFVKSLHNTAPKLNYEDSGIKGQRDVLMAESL